MLATLTSSSLRQCHQIFRDFDSWRLGRTTTKYSHTNKKKVAKGFNDVQVGSMNLFVNKIRKRNGVDQRFLSLLWLKLQVSV